MFGGGDIAMVIPLFWIPVYSATLCSQCMRAIQCSGVSDYKVGVRLQSG